MSTWRTAQHGGRPHGGDRLPACLVDDLALGEQHRALARPLVEQIEVARTADDGAGWGQRAMQLQYLLAVEHLAVVDRRGRALQPVAGIGQHHRHGRQRYQSALIDKLEIIARVGLRCAADAERVEHRVLVGVGVLDVGKFPGEKLVRIDGHARGPGCGRPTLLEADRD
jgi:hypothetical protein